MTRPYSVATLAERWGCSRQHVLDLIHAAASRPGGLLMPSTLPTLALSVRQPWAWAILHARKDRENRSYFYAATAVALINSRAARPMNSE